MKECKILRFEDNSSSWQTYRLVSNFGTYKQKDSIHYKYELYDNPTFEEALNSYLEQGWVVSGLARTTNASSFTVLLTR